VYACVRSGLSVSGRITQSSQQALGAAGRQQRLTRARHTQVNDPVGWTAARLEWWVLWLAAADDSGLLSKEKVRAQYDGTLWEMLAREATKKRGYEIFAPRAKLKQPAAGQTAEKATPAKPPKREAQHLDGLPADPKKV
jgi:hypothetical protein